MEQQNQVSEASSRLSEILNREFNALETKDFEEVEGIQDIKFALMQELHEAWAHLKQASNPNRQLMEELTGKLEICKEQHLRNSLLLNKQMEITRNLLNAITKKSNVTASVYDKLGKMN